MDTTKTTTHVSLCAGYGGVVSFECSGIERIGNLSCGKDMDGIRLNVRCCPNLTSIPITFDPKEVYADDNLLRRLEAAHLREACKKHLQAETIWL